MWGFLYCLVCSLVFSLPFLYTNYLYALPLFLWPIVCRYCHWWVCTFTLFFSYSLLYLTIV
jgi:hypothetical protein